MTFSTVLLWSGLYLPLHVFAALVTFCKQVRARRISTANTQNQLIPDHLENRLGSTFCPSKLPLEIKRGNRHD